MIVGREALHGALEDYRAVDERLLSGCEEKSAGGDP